MGLFLAAACKQGWHGCEIRGQARLIYGDVLGVAQNTRAQLLEDNRNHMAQLWPLGAWEAVSIFFLPVPDEGLGAI